MGSQNNPSSAETASSSTNPRTVPNMQRQASQMSQMSGYESGDPYSESAQSAGTVRRISDAGGARDLPGTYIPPLFFFSPPDLVTRFDFNVLFFS